MADLSDVVVGVAQEQKSSQNRRRHTVVRTCGEEHTGHATNGSATVYLPTDPEMEYISQMRFKLILGEPLGANRPVTTESGTGYPVSPRHAAFYSLRQFYNEFMIDGDGGGVDMDGAFQFQCWDLADFFWESNCGRILQTGPNLAALECWTVSRAVNAGNEFALINNWADVKSGDWCVYGANAFSSVGHINLALEDTNGGTIRCLGQNQRNANLYYGHFATVDEFNGTDFIGAFRYRNWNARSPFLPDDPIA